METIMQDKESETNPAILAIAKKFGKAKKEAWNAQVRRVSRRLLLSQRAEKLTVCCPISGIVTLLEVPAIPDFTAEYEHPLSSLANARGLAQRGVDYLSKLDTQTLAGILIVLASAYDLFKYQLSDSGAQKNALLRTAGKEILIEAVLLIENHIHSRNVQYLPKLSLTQDTVIDKQTGVDIRLHNYLAILSKAIVEPDTAIYDENAPPKKIGRPLYIKDAKKQEKKVSYLARQEIAAAKKELANDVKTAKNLASNLVSIGYSKPGMKPFINQLMSDNGMGLVEADVSLIDMLVNQKLFPIVQQYESEDAIKLIAILKKDRSILKAETSEQEFLDDPAPGNETAIEESSTDVTMTQKEYDAALTMGIDDETMGTEEAAEPTPPEGLSFVEKILWKKKLQEAQKKEGKGVYKVAEIPSTHTYVPSHSLKKED